MTTTLVTLTGDVTDAIGTDFDARRTKAYVRHNTAKIVTHGDEPIHLGGGTVNVGSDGTFTLPNVVAATSLVENLQATVYIDYADPATRQRATATFGPYDLSAETGTVDIRDLEAVQALDPSFASDFMAQAQELLAAQITISGIDDTDAAVAALIEDALIGPLTRAALSASIARGVAPEWQVRTTYAVDTIITRRGHVYRCNTAHTTGNTQASWNATKWDDLGAIADDHSQSIGLKSSISGANDNSGYDSTARINLQSYQALQHGFGEVIRIDAMDANSYQHVAWRFAEDPTQPTDPDTNPLTWTVWMGAHYGNQFEGDPHGHWSVEVPGTDGQSRSRFEVLWCDPANDYAPGMDKTNIKTAHADLTMLAYAQSDTSGRAPVFRLAGSANEKAIEWNIGDGDDHPESRRWHMLVDVTAEAGSDVGSDWALRRFNDAGDTATTVMYAKRSTGNVTFGAAFDGGAQVTAQPKVAKHGFLVSPQAGLSLGTNAAFAMSGADSVTERVLQVSVVSEANARFMLAANGKMEWGSGAATRDVNLYRSAADILASDDGFAPARIFLGGTTNAYIQYTEQTTQPSSAATNSVRVFAEDNGSGKTRLMAKFATGSAVQIAIEP